MGWYYARDGVRYGPFHKGKLRDLARSLELQPEDLVWGPGLSAWVPAREVEGLFQPPPLPGSAGEAAPPPWNPPRNASRNSSGQAQDPARKHPRPRRPGPSGPRRCPSCGAGDVLKLVFGYPSRGLLEVANRGEVALGGCLIGENAFRWRCGTCGHQW